MSKVQNTNKNQQYDKYMITIMDVQVCFVFQHYKN